MDLSVLVPIFVALIGGGAVAFYTARPRKDSLIAEASKGAVEVVNAALERLEEEMTDRDERIARLEGELGVETYRNDELRKQVRLLTLEVRRLGGDPAIVLGKGR